MKKPIPSLTESLELLGERAAGLDSRLACLPLAAFEIYLSDIVAYNEHTNLVSRSDPRTLVVDHVLDSLSLVSCLGENPGGQNLSVVDIGSGAGFPGLPLALALPDLSLTLVESIEKKARFLRDVTDKLGLAHRVEVLCERAESLGREPALREAYSYASARALGALDLIMELAFPLLKPGGALLAPKSHLQCEHELKLAEAALAHLGGGKVQTYQPPEAILEKKTVIIAVTKSKPTPARFPRAMAQIKRQPLGQAAAGKFK